MTNQNTINIGDQVTVIISVWNETENPTFQNFISGKVTEVVERTKHCFYVKLDTIEKLIPIDRVCA